MVIVASVETQTPNLADGTKSKSVAISIVFLLFLFIFFYKPTWGATGELRVGPFSASKSHSANFCTMCSMDLDLRSLLDECASTSRWHGISNAERCSGYRWPILSYLPRSESRDDGLPMDGY